MFFLLVSLFSILSDISFSFNDSSSALFFLYTGICQEALNACIVSLHKAGEQIRQKNPGGFDNHLFLIKHLLILREQLGPLNIDGVLRETTVALPDVGRRLVAAAKGLVEHRSSILALSSNNALLRFLFESTPEVVERSIDSRQELDIELRRACDEFITFCVKSIAEKAQDVVDKASKLEDQNSIKKQSWGSPQALGEVANEFYRNLKTIYPKIRESLTLYIANPDTERLLQRPIRVSY